MIKLLHAVLLALLSACVGDADEHTLAGWKNASDSAKNRLVAHHDNPEGMIRCLDRMAMRPNSGKIPLADAENSCLLGMELKERNASPRR